MRKIDFHIHTVATFSDADFQFCLDSLQKYVLAAKLDAIAITNHDIFDGVQFRTIKETLDIVVYPGIEINIEQGHLLLISDGTNLEGFQSKADVIKQNVTCSGEYITVDQLKEIFGDLGNYLLIPHYEKRPSLSADTLARLDDYIVAGEVDSAKKFIRAVKDEGKLTPVLFSDVRIRENLNLIPVRQTFIDCGELTLDAIKLCLRDKGKVALSESDGNQMHQILECGQMISTGLNVLLGERSSGKTYTLDKIHESHENVQYIRQFSLVQQDEEANKRKFNDDVKRKRSQVIEKFLSGFKAVLDDVMDIELQSNDREVEGYLETLLKSAEEADRKDSFSKMTLFDETAYPTSQNRVLKDLIESVRQVIENVEYRDIVEKHVELAALKRLVCELIDVYRQKALDSNKRKFVNSIVKDIKEGLRMRTSAIQLRDVDLYDIAMDLKKVERFSEIVGFLKKESTISEESVQGFKVVAKKKGFTGAGEIKSASGTRASFSRAFANYDNPYNYLQSLKSMEDQTPSELYKLFTGITYKILNQDGYEVSGGERSEFRLLQEIKDAQNYDILLIDEPESSFDNPFLNSNVNQIIKEISETMPVVVVTHNSTVGASIGADYLLYASKEKEDGDLVYRIYSGHPTDRRLMSLDGKTIGNHTVMMSSLEAGPDTYDARRRVYEAIED
ncbi:MAG: hypothetical protein NPIRA01_39390 [Nitrospirales bacterium]|nr:MAG: hypothetical protein NPIRA01_39390 [Nitrospirales bacterium]